MDVTKSTVSLSWARPRDDGGSRVTGYFVERREVSTEKWVRHNRTHITTTMYNVTGLIPDAEYMFRVVAQNDIGQSEPGPASEAVVCKDPFGELKYCIIDTFVVLKTTQHRIVQVSSQTNFALSCNLLHVVFQINPANQERSTSFLSLKTASQSTGSGLSKMVAKRFLATGLSSGRLETVPGRNATKSVPKIDSSPWAA